MPMNDRSTVAGFAAIAMMIGLGLPAASLAQEGAEPVVAEGARVRATSSELLGKSRVEGSVAFLSADSLVLRVEQAPPIRLSLASIEKLEISRGRRANAVKGTLWGAGIGLTVGVLNAISLPDCSQVGWFDFCEGDEAYVLIGSTVVSTAIGALIGALIKTERWREIPMVRLRSSPEGERVAVGVRLRH